MTKSLSESIAERMSGWQSRPPTPFVVDPDLEVQGERLARLRETDPQQYASPGLAHLKARVLTYRNRKAAAETAASDAV